MTLAGVTRQAAAASESWHASCRRLDIELIWLLDSIAWRAASHGSSLLDDPPTSHPRDDAESESANRSVKVWMHVLGDLKRPGVRDILIYCVDGLTGFPEAIEAVFPRPTAQSAAGATAPLKRPWPRRNGPPRGSSASSSSPLRTASAVRRRPRAKRRQDRRALADQGQAREDLVPAKSTAAPDSLPPFRPLKAVSGAQLVRGSVLVAFRVPRRSCSRRRGRQGSRQRDQETCGATRRRERRGPQSRTGTSPAWGGTLNQP
jgi:hypothetical protein